MRFSYTVLYVPEHRGRELLGARFDTDARFAYAMMPEEEAPDFYVRKMNTAPEVPLAAADAENRVLYLNEEEDWGLVEDAVPVVERPSQDFLGWNWDEDPGLASRYDSGVEYADGSELDVRLVDSGSLGDMVEAYMDRDVSEAVESYTIELDEPVNGYPVR